MTTYDIEQLKKKQICRQCVGEIYLSGEIMNEGAEAECSYCGETERCISVDELSDRIERAFENHYTRTSDQPNSWQLSMLSDRESDYNWFRDGEPVVEAIEAAADIPAGAAADVQAILDDRYADIEAAKIGDETEFSSETHYKEKGVSDRAWQAEWRTFEQGLKTEARFFSRTAAAHLATIFSRIDMLKTGGGRPLIVHAGSKRALKHLYRARVFQADGKLEEALCRPDLHLGSPPARLAAAGRMNARGISVFYGATAARTAIAEVQPPVGSKVAVAKFAIIRPLRLLDLTALGNAWDGGSIFDPSLENRLGRVAFLWSLGDRMTRPVMPDDEDFDYLPTQAIADFLATENEPQLDGIVFRSVQAKRGRNVVLFHDAARGQAMEFPKNTTVEARSGWDTEDGWEYDYGVTEEIPPPPATPATDDGEWPGLISSGENVENDSRDYTLRVDPASIVVHHVNWVSYHSTPHEVSRRRSEKRELNF